MPNRVLYTNQIMRMFSENPIIKKPELAVLLHDHFVSDLLFNIDLGFENTLNAETVSLPLRQKLKDKGLSLSKRNVSIVEEKEGSRWRIQDNNKIYPIRKENRKLNVYSPGKQPVGKIKVSLFIPELLFDIDPSLQNDLNNLNISDGLKQAFNNKGFPLLTESNIWIVEKSNLCGRNERWRIDDRLATYFIRLENGKLNIYAKLYEFKPVQNTSGYYVFSDVSSELKNRRCTIFVVPDYYFREEVIDIELPFTDEELKKNPIFDITLKPVPFYPFPSSSTLIKGVVKRQKICADAMNSADDDPSKLYIPGATVKIVDTESESITTEKGEFVLYPKVDVKQTMNLKITHPRYVEKNVEIVVKEGKTNIKIIDDFKAI